MQVMTTTSSWRSITAAQADAFVRAGAHDAFHLPGFLALSAAQASGEAAHFLYQSTEGAVYLPLIKRPVGAPAPQAYDLVSPYGYPGPLVRPNPGADPAALLALALTAFAQSLAPAGYLSAFIRAHPILTPPTGPLDAGTAEVHTVATGDVVLIDLNRPLDDIFADMRRNHRQNIRRLECIGFRADHDGVMSHFGDFHRLYHSTMQRVHAADYYFFDAAFFANLREAMEDRLQLFVVHRREDIAAAGLFLLNGEFAHYFLAGTDPQYLRLAPSKLLVWRGIEYAKAAGCRWLNLGGGLGGQRDALFDFKQAFSKLTAPYHTWRLVADARLYRAAVARSGHQWVEPSVCQTSFPGYRRQR